MQRRTLKLLLAVAVFSLGFTTAPTTATIIESTGKTYEVQARAPRQRDPLQKEIQQGAQVKKPIPFTNSGGTPEAHVDGPIPLQNRGRTREEHEVVINHFRPEPCVERGTEVNIYGAGFGPRQAGRYVVLGGHGISAVLRVTAWRDGRITALVHNYRRIEQGQWYYIGLQNEDHQWISNISRTINICQGLE